MAENRLNLIVSFMGLDKLSPALRNIIGLGKNSKQALGALNRETRAARGEISKMEGDLKTLNKQLLKVRDGISMPGQQNGLALAEREIGIAITETNAKLVERKALIEKNAAAQVRAQRLIAIEGDVAKIRRQGERAVSSGMSTLMWAGMAAAPIYEMAKMAGEAQAQDNQLRALGLDNQSVKRLENNARRANIAGASYLDMMRYTVEAQGAFRDSGAMSVGERTNAAMLMAPMMAKLAAANKAMGREMDPEQEKYFLRFVEMSGGLKDPRRAALLTDGLFRALGSSGNTLQASDFQEFMSNAGVAGRGLSAQSIFADNEPIIQMIGGKTAGAGLGMAYRMATGIRTNSKAGAEYMKLGLWDKSKVSLNSMGGIKSTNGNPLNADAMNALTSSPADFYKNIILPAYFKAGIVTEQQRNFENGRLFGTSGSKYFGQMDASMGKILNSRASFEKAQSLDKAYNTTKPSFFGQSGQMTAAWKDFMVVAGSKGGLLQNLTAGMRAATGALRAFTDFGNAHPTAFKWITTAVTGLVGLKLAGAVAKIAFGGLKIAFGGLLGPVAKLWGWISKMKEAGTLATIFQKLSPVFGIAKTAVLALGRGFLQAGLWMLTNPMVLLIGGIAIALGLLAYYAYTHWDKIKAAFHKGIEWIKAKLHSARDWFSNIGTAMMQGLVSALNPTLLVDRLLSVAKLGVTAFKNYFGIHSPSRLMMDMGGHIATGLGMGVDQHAHRPLKAMSRLATGIAAAVAVASPAAAHSRAPMQVTINVYQRAGENNHDLAHRVADIIERRQHGHRLSSYADDF